MYRLRTVKIFFVFYARARRIRRSQYREKTVRRPVVLWIDSGGTEIRKKRRRSSCGRRSVSRLRRSRRRGGGGGIVGEGEGEGGDERDEEQNEEVEEVSTGGQG